jgi:hypothetical protein
MFKFGAKSSPVIETSLPLPTPADPLVEAHKELKAAEIAFADACHALAHFYATHPQHVPIKRIGDGIWIQITPEDPELRALTSQENHARNDRANKLDAWSKLKEKLDQLNGKETVHVAGALIR